MTERSYPRAAVTVPLYISFRGRVFQRQVALESKNVSGGGLSFETSRKFPIDASTRVVVSKLGDLPPTAAIEGRIVYRAKNHETGKYAIGVEFTKFVNVEREELLRCIARWEQTQLTPI